MNIVHMDIDDLGTTVVAEAKTRLWYRGNMNYGDTELTAVLNSLFYKGISIIRKWRKLKIDDEFLQGKWDNELTDFIINSYNSLNEENLKSYAGGGFSRTYIMSAESILKSKIPQKMF